MIRIAICDDESCFVTQIESIILAGAREVPSALETSLYTSSGQLLYDVEEGTHFDLLFLDIEMPERDGMSLAAALRTYLPLALIVFITSHTRYAVKAYELSVFRYIPKSEMEVCLPLALRDACVLLKRNSPTYVIESPRRLRKVAVDDIIYVYKEQKYSVMVLADEKIPVRKPLGEILRDLEHAQGGGQSQISEGAVARRQNPVTAGLLLIERGYIVNLFHVDKIEDNTIFLDSGDTLPVSRNRLKETRAAISQYWREKL